MQGWCRGGNGGGTDGSISFAFSPGTTNVSPGRALSRFDETFRASEATRSTGGLASEMATTDVTAIRPAATNAKCDVFISVPPHLPAHVLVFYGQLGHPSSGAKLTQAQPCGEDESATRVGSYPPYLPPPAWQRGARSGGLPYSTTCQGRTSRSNRPAAGAHVVHSCFFTQQPRARRRYPLPRPIRREYCGSKGMPNAAVIPAAS